MRTNIAHDLKFPHRTGESASIYNIQGVKEMKSTLKKRRKKKYHLESPLKRKKSEKQSLISSIKTS